MCTIGRSPARASPPATLTISCSLMPTLSTRSGYLAAALANRSAEISASTTAASGSSSSAEEAADAKARRISLITPTPSPPPRPPRAAAPAGPAANGTSRAERPGQRRMVPSVCRRVTDQPATAKCASMPPVPQPYVED